LIKVLHATFQKYHSVGIYNQLLWENSAAQKLKISWDSRYFCANPPSLDSQSVIVDLNTLDFPETHPFLKYLFRLSSREQLDFYDWLSSQELKYDVVLLRHNPFSLLESAYVNSASVPVFLVHHTKELVEASIGMNLKSIARYLVADTFGLRSLERAFGHVSVTPEISHYESTRIGGKRKAFLVYPNGICYDSDSVPLDSRCSSSPPQLLFVASSFSPWHGLDRLLKSCRQTYERFDLHLVGSLPPGLMKEALSDQRIHVHHSQSQSYIVNLLAKCDVGIAAMGSDRLGMKEGCALKVREYLRGGLPVISDYLDVFPAGFPYYTQLDCNIDRILDCAYTAKLFSRVEVATAAREFIDKEAMLSTLYASIGSAMSYD